jgi:hypothetical protein
VSISPRSYSCRLSNLRRRILLVSGRIRLGAISGKNPFSCHRLRELFCTREPILLGNSLFPRIFSNQCSNERAHRHRKASCDRAGNGPPHHTHDYKDHVAPDSQADSSAHSQTLSQSASQSLVYIPVPRRASTLKCRLFTSMTTYSLSVSSSAHWTHIKLVGRGGVVRELSLTRILLFQAPTMSQTHGRPVCPVKV